MLIKSMAGLTGDNAVWMVIGWLTAVGLLLTLVWSIVLSTSLRFQERKFSEAHASGDTNTQEYTAVEENSKAA